jgi:hypothetical protein
MKNDGMKPCPVCGLSTLRADEIHDMYPICMWEDDPIQSDDPDFWGGANDLNLNQYREKWLTEHSRCKGAQRRSVA